LHETSLAAKDKAFDQDQHKSESYYQNMSNMSDINSKMNPYEFVEEIKRNMQMDNYL